MVRSVSLWIVLVAGASAAVAAQTRSVDVTDLTGQDTVVLLVFGDSGTGDAGQHRVSRAMFETCRARGCDLAIVTGDVLYENGVEVENRSSADASYQEIVEQFNQKFERPYAAFSQLPGFRFWIALGNHDYRRNVFSTLTTYSEFSGLWRLPAFHYEIPGLPDWLQVQAIHTDTDERRDLNGMQVASLKRDLCDERNPDRWKLVFGHNPVYNSGHHRGDGNERQTRAMLEVPLFQACGVHAYFAGHAHHQEHLTATGFEQVIQGAGARITGSNRPSSSTPTQQRFFSRTFGFAIVEVDVDRIRMDFYDVENTREKGTFTPPTQDEIVRTYSWCGTRADIGRPDHTAPACP